MGAMADAERGQAAGGRRIVDPTLSFADPSLRKLASTWQEYAASGRIPDRTVFGPEALHALGVLPSVMLVDVVPGADENAVRFRYRLVGTAIVAVSGRDSTGKFFDELYAPDAYEA